MELVIKDSFLPLTGIKDSCFPNIVTIQPVKLVSRDRQESLTTTTGTSSGANANNSTSVHRADCPKWPTVTPRLHVLAWKLFW